MTAILVYLYILLLMTFCGDVKSLQCPTTASGWERASQALQCKPPNYYHCLRDSESGENTEQCLSKVWIQKEMCPEYNAKVSRIDVFQCSSSDCPPSLYWSNAVFIHPICFKTSKATPATTKPISEQEVHEGALSTSMESLNSNRRDATSTSNSEGAIIGITMGVVAVVVLIVFIVLYILRRNRECMQTNGDYGDKNLENRTQNETKKAEDEAEEVNESLILLGESCLEGTRFDSFTESSTGSNLDKGSCLEGINESSTGSNLVYVVEGQEQSEQNQVPGTDPYLRILVVVFTSSISEGKLLSEAQEKFGPGCKLLSVSSYQEQSREKYETLFTEDFNIKDANSLQLFEKLCEVVTGNKQDAKFVVVLPFSVWAKQRDILVKMFDKDNNLMFQSVYC